MKFRLSLLYLFTILILLGCFALKANAAVVSTDIIVNVVPPNPAPNENTTISLNSYAYNINGATITWSVNGKTLTSGVGKKTFSVTAPAMGSEMNVVATVSTSDGTVDVKTIIKPSVMVLLWQATDSYVPPFYKGKALPTPSSEVKVVAMPEIRSGGNNVPADNMIYAWKKDYTNNVDGSGYGKNSFIYINDYLEDSNNISVTASTIDQKYSSSASVDIGTYQSKVLFYKIDDILGTIWDTMLPDTHKMEGKEIVKAIPYFISPKQLQNPVLVWSWFINDNKVNSTSINQNIMPLQVKEGTHGTSVLRLHIDNTDKIFQTTDKEININF